MADTQLQNLTEATTIATTDILYLKRSDYDASSDNYYIQFATIDNRYLLESNNLSDLDNASTARTNLGLAIGSNVQAWDAQLDDIAALAVTDGNFIVGNGANWVAESGATARASLGAAALAGDTFTGLIQFSGTTHAGIKLNSLTTAQRNALTPAAGMLIYNSDDTEAQIYTSSWGSIGGGGTPGGSDTNIQFNDGGSFGGDNDFNWNKTTNNLTLITTNGIDLNPGSDQDIDVITLGVTGTPKIWWDESDTEWNIDGCNLLSSDAQTLQLNSSTVFRRIVGTVYLGSSTNDTVYIRTASGGDWITISTAGYVAIGATTNPLAKLHVDQYSTTGAKPVLLLDQADIDVPMIEFTGTVGIGNVIEAVGAKSLTTTHFLMCTITGVGTRYIPLGTIA